MAKELHGILYGNVHSVSGENIQPVYQGEESFLRDVITPIYRVLRKVEHFSCHLPFKHFFLSYCIPLACIQ